MVNDRPSLDATAAEYALGTLRGSDRDIFEARLREDAALQSMVARWEDLLTPMAAAVAPQEPPPAVWQRIGSTLGFSDTPPRPARAAEAIGPEAEGPESVEIKEDTGPPSGPNAYPGGEGAQRSAVEARPAFVVRRSSSLENWPDPGEEKELAAARRRTGRWRMAAVALGIVAAILLLIVLGALPDPAPDSTGPIPLTAVLSPVEASPVWTIRFDQEQGRLQVDAIQPGPGLHEQSYVLWALMPDSGPRALGELAPERQTILSVSDDVASRLGGGVPLTITLEPAGGSPTGQPTGSIVHTGRLEPFFRPM
ncbi:anti-sigma factor [Fodinicurvata sp. EGI_FJ10296]|uniref:anti-sigma factor n=1 Tax=Fodinicurvata sp. EGI_FJ10296 TaxID=3231908 RepID=UPI003456E38F